MLYCRLIQLAGVLVSCIPRGRPALHRPMGYLPTDPARWAWPRCPIGTEPYPFGLLRPRDAAPSAGHSRLPEIHDNVYQGWYANVPFFLNAPVCIRNPILRTCVRIHPFPKYQPLSLSNVAVAGRGNQLHGQAATREFQCDIVPFAASQTIRFGIYLSDGLTVRAPAFLNSSSISSWLYRMYF
jgi:hypothetical protein